MQEIENNSGLKGTFQSGFNIKMKLNQQHLWHNIDYHTKKSNNHEALIPRK